MGKIREACKAFWAILRGVEYQPVEIEENEQSNKSDKNSDVGGSNSNFVSTQDAFNSGAIYALLLLQREGRLVDFLQEDITSYDDSQIGAAVRQIHAGARKVLEENFSLRPVFDSVEGGEVSVEENYDPSIITLIGERPEVAPYKGVLQHKGWISTKVDLPVRNGKINQNIVCPAEVSF